MALLQDLKCLVFSLISAHFKIQVRLGCTEGRGPAGMQLEFRFCHKQHNLPLLPVLLIHFCCVPCHPPCPQPIQR